MCVNKLHYKVQKKFKCFKYTTQCLKIEMTEKVTLNRIKIIPNRNIYLLLTEFEVRTISSVTYRENEVSGIFIISVRLIRRAGKETSLSQAEV